MVFCHLDFMMSNNLIDINPPYQREIVWDKNHQQELIETLLDKFPMPALNFHHNDDGTYECMDGKNRLHTIHLFMGDSLESKKGLKFKDLDEFSRSKFINTPVSVCVFSGLTNDEREDYFRRIQNGVTLTKPEIIWSMTHGFMTELKKVRKELLDGIGIIWPTKRYSDLTLFFNIAHVIEGGAPTLRSEYLKKWLKKKPKDDNYEDIFHKIKTVIKRTIKSVEGIQFHTKIKIPLILDIITWIIKNNFKKPSSQKISDFSKSLGLLLNKKLVEDALVIEYFNLAGSRNTTTCDFYTIKNSTSRYQVIEKVLL
jgi:hypothetical protein